MTETSRKILLAPFHASGGDGRWAGALENAVALQMSQKFGQPVVVCRDFFRNEKDGGVEKAALLRSCGNESSCLRKAAGALGFSAVATGYVAQNNGGELFFSVGLLDAAREESQIAELEARGDEEALAEMVGTLVGTMKMPEKTAVVSTPVALPSPSPLPEPETSWLRDISWDGSVNPSIKYWGGGIMAAAGLAAVGFARAEAAGENDRSVLLNRWQREGILVSEEGKLSFRDKAAWKRYHAELEDREAGNRDRARRANIALGGLYISALLTTAVVGLEYRGEITEWWKGYFNPAEGTAGVSVGF